MALGAPSSLAASSVSSTRIDLSWVNGDTYTSISVDRKPYGGSYATIDSIAGASTTYSDTSCSANTRYVYRVRGVSGVEIANSNEDDAWSYPSAPTGPSATGVSTSQIDCTWSIPHTYSSVRVERSTGGAYTEISSESGTATSYSDTGLPSNTRRYYKFRGYNSSSGLYSDYSSAVNAYTIADAPSSLTATTVSGESGETQLDLAWTNNDTYSSIKVETSTGGSYSEAASISGVATSYTVTGLTSGTLYYVRIRGYANGAYTAYSNIDSDYTRPNQPSSLSTTAISAVRVDLSWTNNDTYTTIGIVRDDVLVDTISGANTTYSDTGLSGSTEYTHKVYGTYGGRNSVYSNEDTATTYTAHELTATDTMSISESLTLESNYGVSATDTLGISEVVTLVSGRSLTVTDTLGITEIVSLVGVLDPNYSLYLGSEDGKIYQYARGYTSDDGTAISASIITKQMDFADQDTASIDAYVTLYKVRLLYRDLATDTTFTVYASTDGGVTWTSRTKTLGATSEAEKVSDFFFIETGHDVVVKIEHASDTDTFQVTGAEIYYTINGEYFEA